MGDFACFEYVRTLGRGRFGRVVEVERKSSRFRALAGLFATLIHRSPCFELHDSVRATRSLGQFGDGATEHDRYALKTVEADVDDELVNNEYNMLVSLYGASPHVLRLCDAFWNPDQPEQSFLLEACQGGDLLAMLRGGHPKLADPPRREATARQVARQIGSALFAAHRHAIIHRDVKLENIFFRDIGCREAVLGDWGLSVQMSGHDEQRTDHCGSPHYAAPEIARRRGYSLPADMWALGVVLFAVLTNRFPFYGRTTLEIYAAVERAEKAPPMPPGQADAFSKQALDCISALLDPKPERRLTVAELITHPWLQSSDS